jgi:hemoglobin
VYEGKNMLETHKGMNIDEAEYMAVLDDILDALDKNHIGQQEQGEVLFALYSLRREIMLV